VCGGAAHPGALIQHSRARYNDEFTIDWKENCLAEDKLYQAEYLGSGTFIIRKPKRKAKKLRQLRLKSPGKGMRK
jgi:type IV secretory pathway TrbF-like protein